MNTYSFWCRNEGAIGIAHILVRIEARSFDRAFEIFEDRNANEDGTRKWEPLRCNELKGRLN